MIFDTHAHYNDAAFDEDRDEILELLPGAGICRVVNVASGMDSCIESLKLAAEYPYIYAAVGVHPEEIDGLTEADFSLIERYCRGEKLPDGASDTYGIPEAAFSRVVAVGEIGLDYHYAGSGDEAVRNRQKEVFVRQLDIASAVHKPVIIHSRDAAADTMDIMKSAYKGLAGGVIHCFSYSCEMAKEYAAMGFFIGIGGVLTFKNSRKLRECVETLPLESLVLETDCPYLAPEPNRGRRNSSLNLPYVVSKIAEIKNISEEKVMEQTTANACRLYGLQLPSPDTGREQ